MSTAAARILPPMTVAEFLTWSEQLRGDARFELVRGIMVEMMAPTTMRHSDVLRSVSSALRRALAARGLACSVFDTGPGVYRSEDGDECRVPDVVVTCVGEIDRRTRVVPEPSIVVEVVSESTRLVDVNDKADFYASVPSIQHYLVVEQDKRRVVHLCRDADANLQPRIVDEGPIELDPLGITLTLDELYADTELAAEA